MCTNWNSIRKPTEMIKLKLGLGSFMAHTFDLFMFSRKANVCLCDAVMRPPSFAKCFWTLSSWRRKKYIKYSFISLLDKRQKDRQTDRETERQTRAWLWMEDSLSGSGDVFTTSELWTAFVSLCTLWSPCKPFNSPCLMSLWHHGIMSWTG